LSYIMFKHILIVRKIPFHSNNASSSILKARRHVYTWCIGGQASYDNYKKIYIKNCGYWILLIISVIKRMSFCWQTAEYLQKVLLFILSVLRGGSTYLWTKRRRGFSYIDFQGIVIYIILYSVCVCVYIYM